MNWRLLDRVRRVARETASIPRQLNALRETIAQQQHRLDQMADVIAKRPSEAEWATMVGHIQRSADLEEVLKATAIMTAGLAARANRLAAADGVVTRPAPRVIQPPLAHDEALRRLEALKPRLFPVWRRLFDNGARGYVEQRLGSCSHREHRYALLFGAYLEIHGHGRILDIGCGPYGMPSYLALRHPADIFGLEPLALLEPAKFEVLRGFNEFLPWEDGQFDTVVSGTALDHVLSLDVSLREVKRVLRPNGRYVVWLASIPGAKPYDEHAATIEPLDDFHLFHFDRTWIEPIFERYFDIADVTVVPQVGFDHVFYCLVPRPPATTKAGTPREK